jgi:hypothetical protein
MQDILAHLVCRWRTKENKKSKKVYKIGVSGDKGKASYHKKSESLTQTKMKQLINSKEISLHRIAENPQNTPYITKYIKNNNKSTKENHSSQNSDTMNSPQYQHVVPSSTGSTRELKTVSHRVTKSKSKNKMNQRSELIDKANMSKTGTIQGYISPDIQYEQKDGKFQTLTKCGDAKRTTKHKKTSSLSTYHHNTEAYVSKPKMNAFNQKPTYIILTIDNSDEKASLKKIGKAHEGNIQWIDTPKSTIHTLTKSSYSKQGQSYQQLSSLKKITKKKPTHSRTKSDHIIKPKPAINFKLIKGQSGYDAKQAKNMQIVKSRMVGGKNKFIMNPPATGKVTHTAGRYIF